MRDRPHINIIVTTFILNILGILSLFSALHYKGDFVGQAIFFKQLIWVVSGWVLLFMFAYINYRVFFELSWPIYIITLMLLLGVMFFGSVHMGAKRWIDLGSFSMQPSEFAKVTTVLLMARFFSYIFSRKEGFFRSFLNEVIFPFLPLSICVLLIYKQPDLGTALVIIFVFFLMGLGCGMRKLHIIIIVCFFLLALPFGWHFLKDYQRERIMVFLNPDIDPLGIGYTIIQSKIAIGSGGILGKGFLSGTQSQLNFMPARHTDFIFTVLSEEWGFVGSMFLLYLYYVLLNNILKIAYYARDKFGFCLGIGIFSLFFIHIFINISMVMGLLPVVGIPLAFFSYGGSYSLINFILLGIVFNIYRKNSL